MTGIEAAADAVTGGLFGRAVEPSAGTCTAADATGARCLNCGTALIDEHCHACGQSAHVHRTVGAIGHEIAHGVFHFEGKMPRTLPMLVVASGRADAALCRGRARALRFAARDLPVLGLSPLRDRRQPAGLAPRRERFPEARVPAEPRRVAREAPGSAQAGGRDDRRRYKEIAEERADEQPDAERIAKYEKRIAATRDRASAASPPRFASSPPQRRAGIRTSSTSPPGQAGSSKSSSTRARTRNSCSTR